MTGGGRPVKVAETPLDIAASTGAHAFMQWVGLLPTATMPERTEAETARAERLAEVVDVQVETIRRLKPGG